MRAALLGSGGPVLGREYPLDADLITIGRRDENTIVIKDPTVSRKHAEIRRAGDEYLVVDRNSTSGVLLNGEPISGEQRLKDGDRLGIGMSAVFLVQLQPVEEATVTFSQPPFGDRERTQFVTRTELDDPRGIAADPPPAAANVAPPAAPPREMPRETPPWEALAGAPASPQQREAPPAAALPAAPNYSLPPAGASTPPPTHSAAPPPPFSAAPAAPQYTPPPYTPSYAPQAEQGQGNASWPAQQSASASVVAPPAKSRRGLAIGLVLLLLIILIVVAVVAFIFIRR